jgi:hypothetical protein
MNKEKRTYYIDQVICSFFAGILVGIWIAAGICYYVSR